MKNINAVLITKANAFDNWKELQFYTGIFPSRVRYKSVSLGDFHQDINNTNLSLYRIHVWLGKNA